MNKQHTSFDCCALNIIASKNTTKRNKKFLINKLVQPKLRGYLCYLLSVVVSKQQSHSSLNVEFECGSIVWNSHPHTYIHTPILSNTENHNHPSPHSFTTTGEGGGVRGKEKKRKGKKKEKKKTKPQYRKLQSSSENAPLVPKNFEAIL
jgi:hypothetical protein